MIETLKKHYIHFLMEALGLFIFMASCCLFAGLLYHPGAFLNLKIPGSATQNLLMAAAMVLTALFIFLSPLTSPSGAFINPSVTLMRWRLGQLSLEKMIWYSLFQALGGLVGVWLMAGIMGSLLTEPPVNYAVTVPGKGVSVLEAAMMETGTAFVMIAMVLFVSDTRFSKAVPYLSALLVGVYVLVAGPVSGFGMNPARSLASAIPAGIFTDFWIYLLCPTIGMLLAAELYLKINRKKPLVDFHFDGK